MVQTFHTDSAPAAIGPYSQATRHGDTVYVSGQIPIDPATGEFVEGGVVEQARRQLEDLVRLSVFLRCARCSRAR